VDYPLSEFMALIMASQSAALLLGPLLLGVLAGARGG
jgi:hypothetical protein